MPSVIRVQHTLSPVGPNKNQRVRGGRGITAPSVDNQNVRLVVVDGVSQNRYNRQWRRVVRRDTHHAAAHAAGVHDSSPRLLCRRCKTTVIVYPQTLSDYGYNNNLKDTPPVPPSVVVPL